MKNTWQQNQSERRAIENTKPPINTANVKMRRCLIGNVCGHAMFESQGYGDRFCPACKRSPVARYNDIQMMGA